MLGSRKNLQGSNYLSVSNDPAGKKPALKNDGLVPTQRTSNPERFSSPDSDDVKVQRTLSHPSLSTLQVDHSIPLPQTSPYINITAASSSDDLTVSSSVGASSSSVFPNFLVRGARRLLSQSKTSAQTSSFDPSDEFTTKFATFNSNLSSVYISPSFGGGFGTIAYAPAVPARRPTQPAPIRRTTSPSLSHKPNQMHTLAGHESPFSNPSVSPSSELTEEVAITKRKSILKRNRSLGKRIETDLSPLNISEPFNLTKQFTLDNNLNWIGVLDPRELFELQEKLGEGAFGT
ncbi:hypothetical protein HK096_006292, partial [Nowakowskiella sp. JEL0078]